MKKSLIHSLSCFFIVSFSSFLFAVETNPLILNAFKGLKQMSHKSDYSESISDLYLGYDDQETFKKEQLSEPLKVMKK